MNDLKDSKCQPDLFALSMTTLVASKIYRLGRRYMGIERDKKFCKIVEKRLKYLKRNLK